MKTGKLLYIPDGIYVTYRGITTIPIDVIPKIIHCAISAKLTRNRQAIKKVFSLPTDRDYLASEFEVIEND